MDIGSVHQIAFPNNPHRLYSRTQPMLPSSSVIRNAIFWRSGGQIANQLLSWLGTVALIRLLAPADYGAMAAANVILSFLSLLSSQSISLSLIYQRHIESIDIRNAFGASLVLSILLFLFQLAIMPFVDAYFHEQEIAAVLLVLSLSYLITPFISIPTALCSRNLDFKSTAKIQLWATASSLALAAGLAMYGGGVWALVAAQLCGLAVRAVGLLYLTKWLVSPRLSWSESRRLLKFGGSATLVAILGFCYSQSDVVIAGRYVTAHDLGLYTIALTLAQLPASRILPALNDVGFSVLSRAQDQPSIISAAFLRNIANISFVTFPFYAGLAVSADVAVPIFLGDDWHGLSYPLSIIAVAMPMYTIHYQFAPYLYALGRPLLLALAPAIGLLLMPASFWLMVDHGPSGLASVWLVVFPIVCLLSWHPFLRAIGVTFRQLCAASWPSLAVSIAMACSVMAVRQTLPPGTSLPVSLVVICLSGIISYAGLSYCVLPERVRQIRMALVG